MSPASPSGSGSGGKKPPKAPAWKGNRATSASTFRPASKSAAAGGATWQQERERDNRPQIARVVAVIAALALLGAFLYFALVRPRATPLVLVTAEAYPLRMPPLAFAQEDAALLEAISPQNLQVRKEYRVALRDAQGGLDAFKESLAAAGRSSRNLVTWRQQAVVIYIAAHGAVDARGPCLIPPSADPYNSQEWLPVKDVLAAVAAEPALKNKRKLVVLDCQRALSSWRTGLLENRFAEELPGVVEEAADPNLYVLNAAAPGQIAWAAPELRGSVLGYFLARGLRGEANPGDVTVSLPQLFAYLSANVDGYVQSRRAARQQPLLLHASGALKLDDQGRLTGEESGDRAAHDFSLVFVDRARRDADLTARQAPFDPLAEARKLVPAAVNDSAAAGTTLQAQYTLPDVWRLYDERRAGGEGNSLPAYVVDPVAWASIQQRLSSIQERLLAGAAYQPALPDAINELGRELASDSWRPSGKRPPLNLLAAASQSNAAATAAPRENFVETYLKEPDPAKKNELAQRKIARPALVNDIYTLFTRANRPLTAEDWQAAQQLLALHPPGPDGEPVESHFLTLLSRGVHTGLAPFPAPLVSRALAARQLAEASATPADARGQYALEPFLDNADSRRRDAEDQLFLGDPREQATSLWKVATDGDAQSPGYSRIDEQRGKLAAALRLRDEVWAELPLVAEWHFARWRLAPPLAADEAAAVQRSSDQLVELIGQSIALSDQLEQLAKSRDEAGTFSSRWTDSLSAADGLAATWRDVRVGLDAIAGPLVTRENRYQPGADIREVELVTRTPLLAPDFPRTIFGLYLSTLDEWAKAGLPDLDQARVTPSSNDAAWQPANRKFLQQLHRLLDYEFRVGYDKHLLATAWESQPPADAVFHNAAAGPNSGWSRLRGLLDRYDEEMQRARPPVWDSARSALAASEELRAWDRRVRVSAAWLCSFGERLESPVQARPGQVASHATPARWLQEFDSAHLIAWHATRAASDYWGSGDDAPAAAPPFFAAAVRRCEETLQAIGPQYAPLKYDPPGRGKAEPLPGVQDAALAALREWDPLKLSSSFSLPAPEAPPTTLRIEVRPAADGQAGLVMPAGTAALSVPAAAAGSSGGVRFSFDQAGKLPFAPVKMPLSGSDNQRVTSYATFDEAAAKADAQIAARLWYRGHVRTAEVPSLGPQQYVETFYERKPYTVPTIEVRGNDTVRGSVMFIFDCSASMRTGDGRFADAKASFQELLRELAQNAPGGLRLGLMAYGRRTPATGQYYVFNRRHDDPGNLTPEASRARDADRGGFARRYPHPDRDIAELVPLAGGTADAVLAEFQKFRMEECVGATPLYYSIRHALDTAFGAADQRDRGQRQLVVISDGVNMPYDVVYRQGSITVNRTGQAVNAEEYGALQTALRQHPDTRVTVLLFGGRSSKVEDEQYQALLQLEKDHPQLRVVELRTAKDIAQSIRDSFPKTNLELTSPARTAAPQPLALNQETPVKEWPVDGLLRRESDQRQLSVSVAGEANQAIKTPLALVGGEKVVVQFDVQSSRPTLRFLADERRERVTQPATVKSGLAEPTLELRAAALDPYRKGGVLDMLFVRLRADQATPQFTPRPRYAWAEVDPIGANAVEPTIPVVDASWEDHTELPVLQIPVRAWPAAATQAKLRVWFRYNDPQYLAHITLRRGSSVPPIEPAPGMAAPAGRWLVEEVGGEAGQQRKISVTFEAADSDRKYENLLTQAAWLSPPPDQVQRRLAKDGSRAIYDFIYTRPGTSEAQLDLRIATRQQFERGAYFAELAANVVD